MSQESLQKIAKVSLQFGENLIDIARTKVTEDQFIDAFTDAERERVQLLQDAVDGLEVRVGFDGATSKDYVRKAERMAELAEIMLTVTERLIPEDELVGAVPEEMATEEMAASYEGYSAPQMASIVRKASTP